MKLNSFSFTVKVGRVTVKIYRVNSAASKGGFFYQVADYTKAFDKAGKPKRKLVSFSDFEQAKAEAESIASKISTGDVAALDLRAPERAAYGRTVDLLRPSNTPLELAAARCAEAVELHGDGNRLIDAVKFFKSRNPDLLPSKTVAELIDEMIQEKTAHGKSARYLGDLRNRLDRFSNHVARELRLHWGTVKELEKQYMREQLRRVGTPGPKVIGIDEISIRKGHTYRIVVSKTGDFAGIIRFLLQDNTDISG